MSNNSTNLQDLYNKSENIECAGCTILSVHKPFYCSKDYLTAKEVDILFVTDSYRYNGWSKGTLSEQEQDFFNEAILPLIGNYTYAFTPAVKCPTVKESEMGAKNLNICRNYLEESVKAYKPKLIIPLGNLAFKSLMKKSGITKYHGSEFKYEEIPVVPTYNLSIIFIEPKYLDNIIRDIEGAINKFIHKIEIKNDFAFSYIDNITSWENVCYEYDLYHTSNTIAFDIECTGLNLLTDKILTIALSFNDEGEYRTFCVPIFHKESTFSEKGTKLLLTSIAKIAQNTNNIKVLQNAKFDLRFLSKFGVEFVNVWDTKGMAHLHDEYQNTGLKSMVKRYMPGTLEYL